MTNDRPEMLVLMDQVGNYCLLPRDTLEQGRVPDARRAEIEKLISGEARVARSVRASVSAQFCLCSTN